MSLQWEGWRDEDKQGRTKWEGAEGTVLRRDDSGGMTLGILK